MTPKSIIPSLVILLCSMAICESSFTPRPLQELTDEELLNAVETNRVDSLFPPRPQPRPRPPAPERYQLFTSTQLPDIYAVDRTTPICFSSVQVGLQNTTAMYEWEIKGVLDVYHLYAKMFSRPLQLTSEPLNFEMPQLNGTWQFWFRFDNRNGALVTSVQAVFTFETPCTRASSTDDDNALEEVAVADKNYYVVNLQILHEGRQILKESKVTAEKNSQMLNNCASETYSFSWEPIIPSLQSPALASGESPNLKLRFIISVYQETADKVISRNTCTQTY